MELFCQKPLGACYVICDEWHYKACLGKAADLQKAKAQTQEFLGIAELNQRKWEEDLTLVRRLIDRNLLAFQGVRDWNPDIDGWWIIKALLDDVRRGARLAIKGPRADLFPPPDSTPLRNLAARAVGLPDGEPMRSGRYGPAIRQTRLAVARAAMSGGSSDGRPLDAAVATVGTPAGGGDASTLLGNAQPFEYSDTSTGGDVMELAARGVSQEHEAECFAQYERDMDLCTALGGPMGGARGIALCKQQAFQNYQQCRGY